MTVKELLNQLDDFTDEERNTYLRGMLRMLCGVSQVTLTDFQQQWDNSRPYAEFVKAQNKEIRACIKLELSVIGMSVRKAYKLPVLLETDTIVIP